MPAGQGKKRMLVSVNDMATLYECPSREIWQCRILTSERICIGRAVQQIIEPRTYCVRYLVVYNPERQCRLLLPASLVQDAEPDSIICNISAQTAVHLQPYTVPLSREMEVLVHQAAGCRPYWADTEGIQPVL